MKRVLVLGSTGSIGVQALEVIAGSTDLTVVGLSCGSRVGLLMEQATSLGVTNIAVADPAAALGLSSDLYPHLHVRAGADAAARLVREVEADVVLNAIVGFAGLEATMATLSQGTPLALANKESLVSGGRVVSDLAADRGTPIIPVDSEHSALFQLLAGERRGAVRSLVLTASGGPFRGRSAADLIGITPVDALAHPTWTMGAKISIDSATLMNKGLEVIEAHHLFGVDYGDIEVVVHPQSLVHALVRLVDSALLAHLGMPDMRVPIAYALFHPERRPLPTAPLDLAAGPLEFAPPDVETFRCLNLAREAGRAGDAATCALNAANEVAVRGFLNGRVPFLGIPMVIEQVLARLDAPIPRTYEDIVALDSWAREEAASLVKKGVMWRA
jgi:1-deoxy-D-xylulose 5-phosphate reductoisomerase